MLKNLADRTNKNISELISQALTISEACLHSDHIPNKKMLQGMEQIEQGKNISKSKSVDDLFEKFGI